MAGPWVEYDVETDVMTDGFGVPVRLDWRVVKTCTRKSAGLTTTQSTVERHGVVQLRADR